MKREEYILELENCNTADEVAILSGKMLDSFEAKIQDLELQLSDNHTRAEEIITARENQIDRMHNEIAELELIIKGKDVIIESMAQGKSCENCKHFMSNHSFKLGHSDYLNGCRVLITPSNFSCNEFDPKENQDVKTGQ